MGHESLTQVLRHVPEVTDKNLLVGIKSADDAGVYKLTEELAIINTLDFFPPIIDDPYTFGQIAAVNALSDVYAMGGAPRLAMNIVAFPAGLVFSILEEIINGSMNKLSEAGVLLVGGHSIEDKEIKYGLSVTGLVHPKKGITNAGAKPGDRVIFTKPIGVGVITTALKRRKIEPDEVKDVIDSMKALNDKASLIMQEVGVNAGTDIIGFGLLRHAMEMAEASNMAMTFKVKEIPFFPKAVELVKKSANHPKTIKSNKEYLANKIRIADDIKPESENLLHDPQTSGGLLISVSPEKFQNLLERLSSAGVQASVVGQVTKKRDGAVIIVEN